MICPLHGPVLTENLGHYIGLYDIWSSYSVEKDGIVIAYTSIYGHTAKAVSLLEEKLRVKGCPEVHVFDLARCDISEAVQEHSAAASSYWQLQHTMPVFFLT